MNPLCHLPVVLLFCAALSADDAPTISIHLDGTRVAQEASPPLAADPAAGTGVAWKTEVGNGYSPAIVVGNRVIALVEPETVVCLDLSNGQELWRQTASFADCEKDPQRAARGKELIAQSVAAWKDTADASHTELLKSFKVQAQSANGPEANYGYTYAPPWSDGKHVYVKFTTGVVASFDLEGTRRWITRPITDLPSYVAVAPIILVDDLVVVISGSKKTGNVLQALSMTDGSTRWTSGPIKLGYHSDGADMAVLQVGDQKLISTTACTLVQASTGKVMYSEALGGGSHYAGVYGIEDTIWFGNGALTATISGETAVLTAKPGSAAKPGSDRVNPVLFNGVLFRSAGKSGGLESVDAKTFAVATKIPGPKDVKFCLPSTLICAGGHLYQRTSSRVISVYKADASIKKVGAITFPEDIERSVFPVEKKLIVRGRSTLWCLGQ